MILYLLKVIACSGLLYAFYFFFLQREKMLVFNRWYLLVAVLLSLAIPLIRFTVILPEATGLPSVGTGYSVPEVSAMTIKAQLLMALQTYILPAGMITGSLYFLFRFLKRLIRLFRIAKRAEAVVWNGVDVRLHDCEIPPNSAAGKIFLNRAEWESGGVEEAVLLHEKAHLDQKHFYDVLVMEMLQVCFWFNPFIYLFKKAVRLNHEYQADAAVVATLTARAGKQAFAQPSEYPVLMAEVSIAYQQLLVQKVYVNHHIPLASSFYFSITKKRLLMLQKKTSFLLAVGKAAIIVPLAGGLVFLFAKRIYAQKETPGIVSVRVSESRSEGAMPGNVESLTVTTSGDQKKKTAELRYKNGQVIKEDISTKAKKTAFEKKYGVKIAPPPPPPAAELTALQPESAGPGANAAEMKEYWTLMKKNERIRDGRKVYLAGNEKEQMRIRALISKMNAGQRESVSGFPPPPPLPPVPVKEAPLPPAIEPVGAPVKPVKPVAPVMPEGFSF